MGDLEPRIRNMESTLNRIENAVKGDQEYGVIGLRDQVEKNSTEIQELKDFKTKITYYVFGGVGVGTTLGTVFGWILTRLLEL